MILSLVIVQGNLLQSDCLIVMHQANCQKTMGSGIAKQIREEFPEAYAADCRYYPSSPESKWGKYSCGISHSKSKIVVNLYGQLTYWKPGMPRTNFTDYAKLESAIELAFEELILPLKRVGKDPKVGVPMFMGCARAGGDWKVVSAMLERLSQKHQHDIYAYQFNPDD